MMIGMDVMKLSRSQDGESWRDIGGASGRVGSRAFQRYSYISLSLFLSFILASHGCHHAVSYGCRTIQQIQSTYF